MKDNVGLNLSMALIFLLYNFGVFTWGASLFIAEARLYTLAMETCGKELPRNQHCKVVAMPIMEDE